MTCDEAKNLITVGILEDLDETDSIALRDHLAECPSCARDWERSAELRISARIADEPRLPDWEKSWDIIARGAFPEKKPVIRTFGRRLVWAYAAAAFLTVFVLGWLAGRRNRQPVPETALMAAGASESATPLPAFADSLEPVLIDFLNRGKTPLPPEVRELREQSIRSLISETHLLKMKAEETGDDSLWGFLDELEHILVSMANLNPGDSESAGLLDRMIRERQMRSKLRELSGVKTTL
ncbi:MAG: zf-HC2 domain-containing protein [Candidatus Aminicenantes bacterium]|nr:zf-HC2 domain-containing protein [Candidatus Aminicenantes bacterium]